MGTALVRYVRLLAISQPELDQDLYSLATQASTMLDKMHPGGKIIEGPTLRLHLTDLVNVVRQLHLETEHFLKERAVLYNLRPNQEKKLASSLSHVISELRKCTDINGLVHFITLDEIPDKKSRSTKLSVTGSSSSGSSGGGLFRLKFRRPILGCDPSPPKGTAPATKATNSTSNSGATTKWPPGWNRCNWKTIATISSVTTSAARNC